MSSERVWQVRLPDGSVWIPVDAKPGDARASWIYARSTADMFARDLGGTVIELTPRQRDKVLDQEIAAVLSDPKPAAKPTKPRSPKKLKTRTRPFSREAQRAIATAILENVPLTHAARSAVDAARDADDDETYKRALRTLTTALPASLWIGSDPTVKHSFGMAMLVAPMWTDEDPEGGENPAHWMQIDRDEIARLLVENP